MSKELIQVSPETDEIIRSITDESSNDFCVVIGEYRHMGPDKSSRNAINIVISLPDGR